MDLISKVVILIMMTLTSVTYVDSARDQNTNPIQQDPRPAFGIMGKAFSHTQHYQLMTSQEEASASHLASATRTEDSCNYLCPHPGPAGEQISCVGHSEKIFEITVCLARCRGYTIINYGHCNNSKDLPRDTLSSPDVIHEDAMKPNRRKWSNVQSRRLLYFDKNIGVEVPEPNCPPQCPSAHEPGPTYCVLAFGEEFSLQRCMALCWGHELLYEGQCEPPLSLPCDGDDCEEDEN